MESGVLCMMILNQSFQSGDDLIVWHWKTADIESEHASHHLSEFN